MILPIIAYGDPVLRKVAEDIDPSYPGLQELIANMYETMYGAKGIGLAAPQVGLSIRLFIVDASSFEDDEQLREFKKVFINPVIKSESGNDWEFNEGCLSIPDIREDVERKEKIVISYLDEQFRPAEETYEGIAARIIQHEYDHIEGKLFTDRLSPLKKQLLKKKLEAISKGLVKPEYKMKFPSQKKRK
jgi:peptide deformylase